MSHNIPKGHKPGCPCPICARAPKRNRRKRRNHGYENQMAATLHARKARKNGTVRVPDQYVSGPAVGNPSQLAKDLRTMADKLDLPTPRKRKKNARGKRGGLKCKRTTGRKMRVNSQLNTARTAVANTGGTWFIFDLFNGAGQRKATRIKKLTPTTAREVAVGMMNRKAGKFIVRKVEVAGPYRSKPSTSTVRK